MDKWEGEVTVIHSRSIEDIMASVTDDEGNPLELGHVDFDMSFLDDELTLLDAGDANA